MADQVQRVSLNFPASDLPLPSLRPTLPARSMNVTGVVARATVSVQMVKSLRPLVAMVGVQMVLVKR